RYEKEKSALVVSVVSCQGLPGREPAGPDPYVKLQLLPDKQHKVKTRYSRDEIIGEVVSPLSGLQLHSGEAMALCREIQPRSLKMRSVGRGEVLVSLCWQPAAARLTVVLLKARNLPKMDVTGLADP
ncbi:Synaptotagmin-4, partial [Papilio machaon]